MYVCRGESNLTPSDEVSGGFLLDTNKFKINTQKKAVGCLLRMLVVAVVCTVAFCLLLSDNTCLRVNGRRKQPFIKPKINKIVVVFFGNTLLSPFQQC